MHYIIHCIILDTVSIFGVRSTSCSDLLDMQTYFSLSFIRSHIGLGRGILPKMEINFEFIVMR